MTVMLAGGAGYIGSHTCVELIREGHSIIIFDNFCNSQMEVLNRIGRITGVTPAVVQGDVRDRDLLKHTMIKYQCRAVIHFAGLKSVAESVAQPLQYYDNNVLGTLRLVQAMQDANVRELVFSSSATVYGEPTTLPLKEDHRSLPFNPYGRTKLMVEEMLGDLARSSGTYSGRNGRPRFCPCDGHRRRPLASAGVPRQATPHHANLGTGRGTSVLELAHAFSRASGKEIPVVFAPRRDGDIACCYACPELARQTLGWRAQRDLDDMCKDTWKWQSINPYGYKGL